MAPLYLGTMQINTLLIIAYKFRVYSEAINSFRRFLNCVLEHGSHSLFVHQPL